MIAVIRDSKGVVYVLFRFFVRRVFSDVRDISHETSFLAFWFSEAEELVVWLW